MQSGAYSIFKQQQFFFFFYYTEMCHLFLNSKNKQGQKRNKYSAESKIYT